MKNKVMENKVMENNVMGNKTMASSSLVLRILTLVALAASVGVLVNDQMPEDSDGDRITYKSIITYRSVVAVASIGFAYTILQLPFAMYYARKGKRLCGWLADLDFYGDKLLSLLLATAVGAGFAVFSDFEMVPHLSYGEFFAKGNLAAGIMLLGTLCMALVSILSLQSEQQLEDLLG